MPSPVTLQPPPAADWITIHDRDQPRLVIQARPDYQRCQWQVRFTRWGSTAKMLDQVGVWQSGSSEWDGTRWWPVGARLVPPAVLKEVEAWLRGRAL